MSEVSETASDAWSTDVLASDTEEKQAELIQEIEQVNIVILSVKYMYSFPVLLLMFIYSYAIYIHFEEKCNQMPFYITN